MKPILQKTQADCMVCSLAMLLEISYEEMCEYFPPKMVKETGAQWDFIAPYLRRCGYWFTHYQEEILHMVDWSKPAIVDVPSFSSDEYDHIIFWDGEKVIDPSMNYEPHYKKLPDKINCVIQLAD